MTKRPHSPVTMLFLLGDISMTTFAHVYNAAILSGLVSSPPSPLLSDRDVRLVLSTSVVWG